jgi:hypothetical protein
VIGRGAGSLIDIIVRVARGNLAAVGTVIEDMNRGYQVNESSDSIAGDPPEYVGQPLRYPIRNAALVVSSDAILESWAKSR